MTTSTTIAAMTPPADTAPPWHTAPELPIAAALAAADGD